MVNKKHGYAYATEYCFQNFVLRKVCEPTSGAKSDVIFLLGDPDFLLGRRNFTPILLSYRDPHFGRFGFWGFSGYLATSGAKSDVIFLLRDPDFLLRRRNFAPILLSYRDPHFGLFGFFGGLGVFSYFRCKIWRRILARRPRFPIKAAKFRAYLA